MRLLSCCGICVLLALFAAPVVPQTRPILPTVVSYALDKSKITLPDDLTGSQNLLILYFQPDQNDAALAWLHGVDTIRIAHPGLQTYLLPVYARENFLSRWWIDISMRNSAPPSQDWHTTIPLFVDKPAFLRPIGIASVKQPAVVLTDRTGRIEWKVQGSFETPRLADLGVALDRNPGAQTR